MPAARLRHCRIAIVLLLAACAGQPRHEFDRPARETITGYSIEGRVSVKRGNEANNAGIEWLHREDSDDISFSGPLGQKVGRLRRDSTGATLEQGAQETIHAADWSGLAERVLGVALPLGQISRWLTAADIGGAETDRDHLGRPLQAVVDGWRLDYLSYESADANALPTLIEIKRDDIKVRLKIDQWQIN